jgi:hypothetical protein
VSHLGLVRKLFLVLVAHSLNVGSNTRKQLDSNGRFIIQYSGNFIFVVGIAVVCFTVLLTTLLVCNSYIIPVW